MLFDSWVHYPHYADDAQLWIFTLGHLEILVEVRQGV